jgi:hypothetical protein
MLINWDYSFIKYSNNTLITDKSNPLFTLAQNALEKERKDQQHDVTQKVSISFLSMFIELFFTLCVLINKLHDIYVCAKYS